MVSTKQRAVTLVVVVAALGYFVDIYDLILYGTVRAPSLADLGYTTPAQQTDQGVFLFNMQMAGVLVGGVLWGVLGDKRGRLSVLFGSIITYSLANLANGAVTNVTQYAVCRAIAGIGLAGELGAGITLVTELMDKRSRGIGTTIVAGVGVCGGVAAGLISGAIPSLWEGVHWRTAYYIGGGMGIALLALRIGVAESGMFHATAAKAHVRRGDFFALFRDRRRALRYLGLLGVGVPVWYVVGILITFADPVGHALGLDPAPRPPTALMFTYAGLAGGDIAAGLISQWLRSRRRALALFISASTLCTVAYFTVGGTSHTVFYALCTILGFFVGYWAVFVTTAAEQFGTNLRATVATTTPNFVRGSALLLTMGFKELSPSLGVIGAAVAMGVVSLAIAVLGLATLRETYGADLDFTEEA